MKTSIKIFFLLLVVGLSSCNYLDIVPDEVSTDKDAFNDQKAAERYLYSCYSFLPNPRNGTSSLDLMTGDEVVTAFEHETFANFAKGNYMANNITNLISYWDTLFGGIRQCHILINNIDGVPLMDQVKKDDYKAQAKFLIAYYHFLLLRSYGPTILVKDEPKIDTKPSDFLGRTPYDECVQWIADMFDEAALGLPTKRDGTAYGLATSVAAKAIKARMYLYAASPLFNGNSTYAGFTNPDGTQLISTTYDPQKWVKAAQVNKEAIQAAESAGYKLYEAVSGQLQDMPYPTDMTQRSLRFTFIDKNTSEVLWADTRSEPQYGFQRKGTPYLNNNASGSWNGIAPTLTMVERFYTENGLPIDQDPTYDYANRYGYSRAIEADGDNMLSGSNVPNLAIHREPRFYAWVAFHNGYYEILRDEDKRIVCNFTKDGNCGYGGRTNNYSPTAFLNKKGVPSSVSQTTNGNVTTIVDYPWPNIRLGELYLNYAEACVETNDLPTAISYINEIRARAGIPSLETAWGKIGVALTQSKLREIVRQERAIELYFENHNFWDQRRWLNGEKYFNVKARGLNYTATTEAELFQEREVVFERKFLSPRNYLMPIPYNEVNKNEHLVQNPGY